MLNLLESRLRYLYEVAYQNGNPNMAEINNVKKKIEEIRDELAEGIKVRSRITNLQNDEKLSKFVIAKQQEFMARKLITCLKDEKGNKLQSSASINNYVKSFYSNLYNCSPVNNEMQEKFLSFLKSKLDDIDREELNKDFSKGEILKIIRSFNKNRTPGIDGLPVEFYLENWDIIGDDFTSLVKFIMENKCISVSQRKGVITLIHKGGEEKELKNWRPISLLCVDYKIISKLLANRMKEVLDKVIGDSQFCCIPGRSIVHCNMLIRDVIYYVNSRGTNAAFLKLDWHKAFDLVNTEFLFKSMKCLGFGDEFVTKVSMLYNQIESAMCINNNITSFFPIKRSVRQGCPLSMMLYAIYQESFFLAIKENVNVKPLVLPDHTILKSVGYADDNNIIITSEDSLKEVDNIVKDFELATNSKINRNEKSRIYSMGGWKDKRDWPLQWVKQDTTSLFTLGIHHCNDYKETLKNNWELVINKIDNHVKVLHARKLNLFQRTSYANTCILAKIWYITHVYPLTQSYGIRVERLVFRYIWCGRYEPIKRSTMNRSRTEGGLSVFDVRAKANAIIVNTLLKTVLLNRGPQSLILYYCYLRLSKFLDLDFKVPQIFCYPTPYYSYIIGFILKLKNVHQFPMLSNKTVYQSIFKKCDITVECKYPLFDWKIIWKNFCAIDCSVGKEIIFKHLHDVLPVKKRLHFLNLSENTLCEVCNIEESAIHLFYFCKRTAPVFKWLRSVLKNICNFEPENNIKFLYFEFNTKDICKRNVYIFLLGCYIYSIWCSRKDLTLAGNDIIRILINNINDNKRDILLIYGDKVKNLYGPYLEKLTF